MENFGPLVAFIALHVSWLVGNVCPLVARIVLHVSKLTVKRQSSGNKKNVSPLVALIALHVVRPVSLGYAC